VKDSISAIIGEEKMSFTLNQDECTARGCAIMCAMLSPKIKVLPFEILDSIASPVKLTWQQTNATDAMEVDGRETGENSIVIFKKKDGFPKEMKLTFKRTSDFQLKAVALLEGTPVLGEFNIGMAKAKAAIAEAEAEGRKEEVRVFVRYDKNGIVNVASAEYMKRNKQPEPEVEEPAVEEPSKKVEEGDAKKEDKATGENQTASGEAEGDDAKKGGEKAEEDSSAEKPAKKTKTEKKVAKKKKAAKKVPKFTRIKLEVTRVSALGLESKRMDEFVHTEATMQHEQKKLKERDEARNNLESYVYSMRDTLDQEEYTEYMNEQFKATLLEQLEATEEWLYTEEGFDSEKKIFAKRLTALNKEGTSLQMRKDEWEGRVEVVADLRVQIAVYTRKADTESEATAHWTSEDRKTLRDACVAAEQFVSTTVAALDAMSKHEDPTTTCAQIREVTQKLHKDCRPVVTKKAPAPKVEEPVAEKAEGAEEKTEGAEEKTEGAEKAEGAETEADAEASKKADAAAGEAAAEGDDKMETD